MMMMMMTMCWIICASYLHDLDTPKLDVESNFVCGMIIYGEGDFKAISSHEQRGMNWIMSHISWAFWILTCLLYKGFRHVKII
jgi:hypothetical protein